MLCNNSKSTSEVWSWTFYFFILNYAVGFEIVRSATFTVFRCDDSVMFKSDKTLCWWQEVQMKLITHFFTLNYYPSFVTNGFCDFWVTQGQRSRIAPQSWTFFIGLVTAWRQPSYLMLIMAPVVITASSHDYPGSELVFMVIREHTSWIHADNEV